ncbi:MAG: S-adenosylmethionine decarboxylase [Rubrivivax sp.]
MDGLHLTAELHECAAKALLAEPAALRALCLAAVAEAGLTPVGELFHHFTAAGGGITGVVLLAESHLAVHTWPELGAVTLDDVRVQPQRRQQRPCRARGGARGRVRAGPAAGAAATPRHTGRCPPPVPPPQAAEAASSARLT